MALVKFDYVLKQVSELKFNSIANKTPVKPGFAFCSSCLSYLEAVLFTKLNCRLLFHRTFIASAMLKLITKKTKGITINILHTKVALLLVGYRGFLRLLWPSAKTFRCAQKKDAGLGCGGRGESEIAQPCVK